MRNLLNNCANDIDFLEWGGVTYILTNYREERKMANLKRGQAENYALTVKNQKLLALSCDEC